MHLPLLDEIPLFAGLSDDEKSTLALRLRVRDVPARETLFWTGDEGEDFYVIKSGRIAILYPDGDGREITLAILSRGEFLGEVALLDGGPRTATARATTDTSLLCLNREDFQSILRTSPAASLHVIQVLSRRQRESLDKLRGIRNLNEMMDERQTAWQRVAHSIASMAAGRNFLLSHAIAVAGWILLNIAMGPRAPDPFPFPFLCFWTSCEAIFLSLFILISQESQSRKDRTRTELEYQVAMKAHVEIIQLHRKIDELPAQVLAQLRELDRQGEAHPEALRRI
jgi:CRP/FNR family cyclic AMP-dependent transcriptional regulator